jgi:serine/threonine-protein kinase
VIGTSFGHYRVTGHLGKGGMGDVYRAHDPRLGRDVALKLLPPEFTADAERLQRFEREAKLLASLNHPNIASIYGLEWLDGQQCLVLELVDGENLAERLARGAMPLAEALPIAAQIAEALETAHERGVIHRDLKPGNVMVDGAGRVKLLDFGLAKTLDHQPADGADFLNSPTMSGRGTQVGVILGTAPYMSPEQARGKTVDTRTDIWAFGCVLFEMLTGSRPFTGSDVTEVLSAIIQVEPAFASLPADENPRDLVPLLSKSDDNCARNVLVGEQPGGHVHREMRG